MPSAAGLTTRSGGIFSTGDLIADPQAAAPVSAETERKPKRKWKIDGDDILAVVIVSAAVAAAAFFHWGPFSLPKVDYHTYIVAVQKEIKSHWHPPKRDFSTVIKMHFKIQKNGEVTDVGFDRMSRLPDDDAAALKSLIASMPSLPPLPSGAAAPVDIDFTFEYNVSPGNAGSAKPDK